MGHLRRAAVEDAAAIARIHVVSWQQTYTGLMPDTFLARMTDEAAYERRRAFWSRHVLSDRHVTLVAEVAGEVVAFASGGPSAEQGASADTAELDTLYALASAQGQGWGRLLTVTLARELQALGHRSLGLWVLRGNPARDFYLRMGATEAGQKEQAIQDGPPLHELRMVWPEIGMVGRPTAVS